MNKYAEIYGGVVRDLRESYLSYAEFCSIFDPTSYWVDVTGVADIAIGHVVKFSPERGTYFEKPTPIEVLSSFEEHRNAKMELLKLYASSALSKAYVESSLGFRADADDVAATNIRGLITAYEGSSPEEKILFRDYDDLMQTVQYKDLSVLLKEVAKCRSHIYAQKWQYEEAIISANTDEDLDKIEISFKYLSFMEA